MMKKEKTWKCTCGGSHTGHVLDPEIWPEEAKRHQPVSTWEYRQSLAKPM